MAERVDIVVTAKDEATKTFTNIKNAAQGLLPFSLSLAGAFGVLSAAMVGSVTSAQKVKTIFDGLSTESKRWGENVSRAKAEAIRLSEDGLMTMEESAQALKLLLPRMGLRDAIKAMEALKDVSAANSKETKNIGKNVVDAAKDINNYRAVTIEGTTVVKKFSDTQKTLNELYKESSNYQGEAARASKTLEAQISALNTQTELLKASFGELILPTLVNGLGVLNGMAKTLNDVKDASDGFSLSLTNSIERYAMTFDTIRGIERGLIAGLFGNSDLGKDMQKQMDVLDLYTKAVEKKKQKELEINQSKDRPTNSKNGKTLYIRDNELQMEKAHADLIEAQHQRIAKANEAYQRDGLDRDKAYYQALVDAKTKYDKEYADAWEKSHKESIERNAKELKAQQDAQDELLKGFKEAEEKVRRHKEMMQRIYGEMGLAISEATAQAFLEGRDGFKVGARQMMIEIVNFIEKEYLAAQIGIAVRALLSGPFAAAELGKVAALVAAGTGLEMLKGSVGSMQSGDTVSQAGTYMLHKNERVLSDVDNRQLVSKLDSIDKRLAGMNTGGNMTVYAMDAQSFQQFMRRTGNSVMQYEVETGRLKI